MKTAGLITFHHSTSLGANLQAYALQTVMVKLGYKTEIINYNRKYINKKVQNNSLIKQIQKDIINSITKIINQLNWKENNLTKNRLIDFRNYQLQIGKKIYNKITELKESPPLYDVYITGSDQVWNPYTFFLEAYFLTFAPKIAKRIAYGPSIGVTKIDEEKKSTMKKYLNNIDYISCREEQGAKVLEEITGREVTHVLDPTLLLSPDDWKEIAISIEIKKPYLLCYFLGSLKYGREIARRVAKEKKLDIVIIPSSLLDTILFSNKQKGIGPREFLGLFKEASFICSDSFHGTAFAINYNKPFLAFKRRDYKDALSNVSRLESITNILGLSHRLVSPEDEWKDEYLTLDFNEANIKLQRHREISMNFLKGALL